jgi:hypothetical protein
MSRQAGSIVREDFKAAPDIRQSGPAAGGGYVLRARPKVKVARNQRFRMRSNAPEFGSVEIKGLAGRSGRARTCDPRFWRPYLNSKNQELSGTLSVKPARKDQRVSSVLSNPDWPPDPETRSPRNGGNRARANRKIEVLKGFEDTLPAHQAQQLHRRFALSLPYAELVAFLYFGRAER